jgi:hypothetical protein
MTRMMKPLQGLSDQQQYKKSEAGVSTCSGPKMQHAQHAAVSTTDRVDTFSRMMEETTRDMGYAFGSMETNTSTEEATVTLTGLADSEYPIQKKGIGYSGGIRNSRDLVTTSVHHPLTTMANADVMTMELVRFQASRQTQWCSRVVETCLITD